MDLQQEITMQLWRAFQSYDEGRTFATWMYRIALNVAISFVRKSALRARHSASLDQETVAGIPDEKAPPTTDARVAALDAFANRLDAMNRALLVLYLEERSYRDIAEVLGISETNVATKISRLKQRIRSEIADQPQNDRSTGYGI